jgi:transposase
LAQAVVGRLAAHHAFLLSEQLAHLDDLEEASTRVSAEIDQRLAAEREAMALLDTMPGVSQRTAQVLLADLGADLSRFPSAGHLASWAGMCPGNAQSGGKRLSGKTRKGNAWLRRTLVEVAHVAAKTKETYLAAQYRRMAARRGKKRALIAVGHSVLVMISHILTKRTPYQELGGSYFAARERNRVQQRLVHRLERLGFAVTLTHAPLLS